MQGYLKIRKNAINILKTKLSEKYCYHSINHTLETLKVCNDYIKREKIESHDAKLLRIAVLYHDIGFTVSNIEHENLGSKLAQEIMTLYRFPQEDIDIVMKLILATKIPQNPKNKLEFIICDADLDYLGKPDFYTKSDLLFKELMNFSLVTTKEKWNEIQIEFLKKHRYHTTFAKKYRQPQLEKRLSELIQLNKTL